MNFRKVQPEALVKWSLGALHSHIACLAYWNWLEGSTTSHYRLKRARDSPRPRPCRTKKCRTGRARSTTRPGRQNRFLDIETAHSWFVHLICSPDTTGWQKGGQNAGGWGAASVRSAGTPYLQAKERFGHTLPSGSAPKLARLDQRNDQN